MPALKARSIADVLAGASRLAFERMRRDPMSNDPDTGKRNVGKYTDELTRSLLAALDEITAVECLPEELQAPAAHAYIDAVIGIGAITEGVNGNVMSLLPRNIDFLAPLKAMLRSPTVARAMRGIPAPPRFEDAPERRAGLTSDEMGALAAALQSSAKPSVGPLFSEACKSHVDKVRRAKGETDENVGYYSNVAAAFIAICGDRPVNDYKEDDLQHFVNEISYLPPNFSKGKKGRKGKRPDFTQVNVFIEENKKSNGQGLALGSIMDNYLRGVRTVIRAGFPRPRCDESRRDRGSPEPPRSSMDKLRAAAA